MAAFVHFLRKPMTGYLIQITNMTENIKASPVHRNVVITVQAALTSRWRAEVPNMTSINSC